MGFDSIHRSYIKHNIHILSSQFGRQFAAHGYLSRNCPVQIVEKNCVNHVGLFNVPYSQYTVIAFKETNYFAAFEKIHIAVFTSLQ